MLTRGRLLFVTLSLATVLLVAAGRMLAEQSRHTEDKITRRSFHVVAFLNYLNEKPIIGASEKIANLFTPLVYGRRLPTSRVPNVAIHWVF